ncbi:hypothetical protein MTX80_01575 [Gordonia amicalis]|nr:hypothetical protein [Gordonia amicalis]UOG21864.1 hypothetical protein MTX80_01575 [Gordonia amicalis]
MAQNTRLVEVLTYLHDRFSALATVEQPQSELLRGFRAGMTFARICVLDEITTESLRPDAFVGAAVFSGGLRRDFDVVQGLVDRLEREGRWAADADDSEFRVGYYAALGIARDHLDVARRTLDIGEAPAGVHRPVRSRSRRAAAVAAGR